MNSIAFMPTKKPAPSKESLALASLMRAKGVKNADLARELNVDAGYVSQWKNGTRPIPAKNAQAVALALGTKPELISTAYAEMPSSNGNLALDIAVTQDEKPRLDLTINRLENGIDSLRLALGVMAGVMLAHRPAEAADVARSLRKNLKGKFVNQGFVKELLEVLESNKA